MADMDNSGGTGDGRQGWLGRLIAALAPDPKRGSGADRRAAGDQVTSLGHISAIDLADVVPDPIVVFDRTGSMVHANQAAVAAFGAFRLGSSVQLKFRAPEMQALIGAVLGGDASASSIDYSERVPVDRLYRVAIRPVGTASGLFAMTFRDQSEARRIDRMRADFIANASHELRTPLASISGFIETLRGPARNDAKARERFLGIMEEQTARMARLIDDLLSLSRLEMKSHHNPSNRVDLVALIGGVVDTLGYLAGELGVVVEKKFPDHPVFVAGERDELIQVFVNLLENAIRYTPEGGEIQLIGRREHGEAVVEVRDTGPGIAPEDLTRLFEPFYRADKARSNADHVGLGLSLASWIVHAHAGQIEVESHPGAGSVFTVCLPLLS
ncbi:MAG: sensor histidine kinase [Rhizobiaceae bacterium]